MFSDTNLAHGVQNAAKGRTGGGIVCQVKVDLRADFRQTFHATQGKGNYR